VSIRTVTDYRTPLDLSELRRLHEAGASLGEIARTFRTTVTIVRARAKEMGLPARPVGRPIN
jgi:hypothetical protein